MKFPCVGAQREWQLTDDQIAAWQQIYPWLNVDRECAKAWAWIDAVPSRRKTARGMKRYLVAWLNRAEPERRPLQPWSCPHVTSCGRNKVQCDMKLVLGSEKWPLKERERA